MPRQPTIYLTLTLNGVFSDVFLVCMPLDNPGAIDNAKLLWLPEIKKHCPKTPIILVGTKLDLREDAEVGLWYKSKSHLGHLLSAPTPIFHAALFCN